MAISITEAEYINISTYAKQAIWLVQLLRDIDYTKYLKKNPWIIKLRGDNKSFLALIYNFFLHDRSKYINIFYYYIRDLEKRGRIEVEYIGIENIIINGLIKPLSGLAFNKNVSLLDL